MEVAAAQSIAMLAATDTEEGTTEIYNPWRKGVVKVDSLKLYYEPSLDETQYNEVGDSMDTEIVVYEKYTTAEGDVWYKVKDTTWGMSGYVPADQIELTEAEEETYTKIYFDPALRAKVTYWFPLYDEANRSKFINEGTEVSVEYKYLDSDGDTWYGVKLVEDDVTYTGVTMASNLELIDKEPEEVLVEAIRTKDGISLSTPESEGTTYQWQRKTGTDEEGNAIWENVENGTSALLSLPLEADALLSEYRCVTTKDDTTATSQSIFPVTDDWIEWLKTGEVTLEMIERALGAKSLESIVMENNKLVYVRDGKAYATYDPETGYITDTETGLIVAMVDESGVIQPILPEDAQ